MSFFVCPSIRDTLDYVMHSDYFSSTINICCFSAISSEFRHDQNELILWQHIHLLLHSSSLYARFRQRYRVFSPSCADAERPGVPTNMYCKIFDLRICGHHQIINQLTMDNRIQMVLLLLNETIPRLYVVVISLSDNLVSGNELEMNQQIFII